MEGNTMALGKRNNGKFRPSSVEVGAPRIWIHLNRIRKKQLEEKTETGHSLHDVVSLQLFSFAQQLPRRCASRLLASQVRLVPGAESSSY
jgi:hypothetical protein